jgi:hypothetical protein
VSLGASIFLLVVGAVLTFAVDVTASGFSINTVGIILMVAGALGVVLSLLFWSSFSPYRRGAPWWAKTRSWRSGTSGATFPEQGLGALGGACRSGSGGRPVCRRQAYDRANRRRSAAGSALRRRLGNAVLLTHDGYGHLSRRDPSTCVPQAPGSYRYPVASAGLPARSTSRM